MTNDKALEAALKACPFCGGTPILSKSGGSSEVDGYTTFHVVSCKSCRVEKHAHSKPYTGPSEEVAIGSVTAAWNRRVPVSALPGEAEVVEFRGDAEKIRWLSAERERLIKDAVNVATQRNDLLLSLQAMQARAEAAERERDAFRDMADGYGKLDAGLAIAERRAEAADARVKEMEEALRPVEQALKDWLSTYAPDLCEPSAVEAARARIGEHGTIAYIADALSAIRSLGDKT